MGSRKYFLDWLRVFAFAFLILFHVGCLYCSWDYNLKSPRLVPQLDAVLLALTPWRMVLLFFISGVASRCLLGKLGAGRFTLDRLRRLVPVILTGMFIVIPPQTYVMLLGKGLIHDGYLHFWLHSYLAADQSLVAPLHRTMPTYDHLWFLVYLLVYTLIFAAAAGIFRIVDKPAAEPSSSSRLPMPVLLIAVTIWLTASNLLIERVLPVTFYVVNDWGSHIKWFGMFIVGALCAPRDDCWQWAQRRRASLLVSAALYLALQSYCHALWLTGKVNPLGNAIAWSLSTSLYACCMTAALCGYARAYLNQGSRLLSRLNEAILPVYVLHQPILLIAAHWIFPVRLPMPLEATFVVAITGIGSFAIYAALIRPLPALRFLFGLKSKAQMAPFTLPAAPYGLKSEGQREELPN
jgi:hypothetical protein